MNKFVKYALLLSMTIGAAQGSDKGIWAKITAKRDYLLVGASLGSSAVLWNVARRQGCAHGEIACFAAFGFFAPIVAAGHTHATCSGYDESDIMKLREKNAKEADIVVREVSEQQLAEKVEGRRSKRAKDLKNIAFVSAAICVPLTIGLCAKLKNYEQSNRYSLLNPLEMLQLLAEDDVQPRPLFRQ